MPSTHLRRTLLFGLLPLLLSMLTGCRTAGTPEPDPVDLRSRRLTEWIAEEYLPPTPNFSDAEKFYFPVALARMELYGSNDPQSNFGDPDASLPPFDTGILDFRGRLAEGSEDRSLMGFVTKDPFHFILLGMSRLLFAHPDAPALVVNRDVYLRSAMERTDNYNAFTSEGTENHINMSRTAGYIYASEAARTPRRFPGAEARVKQMRTWLLDWSRLLYETGDGEWNSSIYTAYNMAGWFNVFDYTAAGAIGADPEVHNAARAVLDYYAAQLALHYSWGLLGGAEMRGQNKAAAYEALSTSTDYICWLWFAESSADPPGGFKGPAFAAVYAALSDYRPPAAVRALASQKHARPGNYRIASPGYIMTRPGETLRSLYVGRHFTLGSASMPVGGWVGSTTQIVNWKLLAEAPAGGLPRLVWGNGAFRGNEAGNVRNPWDQFAQYGAVLVQMTRVPEEAESIIQAVEERVAQWAADWNRDFSLRWPNADREGFKDGEGPIRFFPGDLELAGRNRLFFPPDTPVSEADDVAFLDLDPVFLAVRSLAGDLPLNPVEGTLEDAAERGSVAGLLVEVGEAGRFDDMEAFRAAVRERTVLDRSGLPEGRIVYTNLDGERISVSYAVAGTYLEPEYDMAYGVTQPVVFIQSVDWIQPDWPEGEGHGRVPEVSVNGQRVFPRADLPHVSGPQLTHGDSVLRVRAGGQSYRVDYSGERPTFRGRR